MDNIALPADSSKTPERLQDKDVARINVNRLARNIPLIPQRIAALNALYDRLCQEQQALLEAGIIEASPYWH